MNTLISTRVEGTQQVYWSSTGRCNVEVWMHKVGDKFYYHHSEDRPNGQSWWMDENEQLCQNPNQQ